MCVVRMFVAPAAKAPMVEVYEVEAVTNRGLRGDYRCSAILVAKRSITNFFHRNTPQRQVTLIDVDDAVAANMMLPETDRFDFPELRRNIVTTRVDLSRLVGRTFRIGDVVLRGTMLCVPCAWPARLAGKLVGNTKPFYDAFGIQADGRCLGGLCAEVVSGGTIRVGADIEVEIARPSIDFNRPSASMGGA